MKREELIAAGVPEEAIDKVMALHGKSIQSKTSELEVVKGRLAAAETTLKEKDEAIKELGKSSNDLEAIVKEKEALEQTISELNDKLSRGELDIKINEAISTSNARDPKVIKALLDNSKIKINEDGNVEGLEEQIQKLSKESPYLFQAGKKTEYNPGQGGGSPEPEAGSFEEAIELGIKNQLGSED